MLWALKPFDCQIFTKNVILTIKSVFGCHDAKYAFGLLRKLFFTKKDRFLQD